MNNQNNDLNRRTIVFRASYPGLFRPASAPLQEMYQFMNTFLNQQMKFQICFGFTSPVRKPSNIIAGLTTPVTEAAVGFFHSILNTTWKPLILE